MFAYIEEEPFPTVERLDNEYDSWPESVVLSDNSNSHIIRGHTKELGVVYEDKKQCSTDHTTEKHVLMQTTVQNMQQRITQIVQSTDKLFFIAYRAIHQERREWQLIQVDLDLSMKLHSACLSDGRFLCVFYIEHYNNEKLNLTEKRFWIEYHQIESTKTPGSKYHLIQPSPISSEIEKKGELNTI